MGTNGNSSSKLKDEDTSSVSLIYYNTSQDASKNDDTLLGNISQTEDGDDGKLFRFTYKDFVSGFPGIDKPEVFDKLSKSIQRRDLDSLQMSVSNLCRSKYTKVQMLIHQPGMAPHFEPTQERLIPQAMIFDFDYFKYLFELYKDLIPTIEELQPTDKRAQEFKPLTFVPLLTDCDEYFFHHLAGKNAIAVLEYLNKWPGLRKLINQKNFDGAAPLLQAIISDELPVAERLVELGAHIDSINIFNNSPIYLAALNGHVNLIKKMLSVGKTESLQVDVVSNDNIYGKDHSIFYPAVMSGKTELVVYLQGYVENSTNLLLNEMKNDNRGPLESSIVRNNMTDVVNFLLLFDDSSSEEHFSNSVILGIFMRAVELNKEEIVSKILKSSNGRAALKFTDSFDRGVLHYAVNHPKLLKYLLNKAEELLEQKNDIQDVINRVDKNRCPALHYAALAGEGEALLVLAQWNVRFNHEEKLECDYILSCASCDKCANNVSLKAIKYAVECTRSDQNSSVQVTKGILLNTAASYGRIDLLKYLFEIKVPSKMCDKAGRTALHAATHSGSLPAVEFITENLASLLNVKDIYGDTAVCIAAERNHHSILKHLFNVGVKPEFGSSVVETIQMSDSVDDETYTILVDEILKFSGVEGLAKVISSDDCWPKRDRPKSTAHIFNQFISDDKYRCSYDFTPLKRGDGDYISVMQQIVDTKNDECLKHPLIRVFLKEKLNSGAGRIWYIVYACLYFAFLALLTTYIGLYTQGSFSLASPAMIILTVFILLLSVINMIKEILQMKMNLRNYVFEDKLNNILEWTLYICTLVFLLPPNEEKSKFQIEAGSIAIFIAWINFIWFLKRMPEFGIYVVLTKKVFFSLLKVLPVVILFIIAFAMTFMLLRRKDYAFSTVPWSALTTFIMMGGEIDYRDVFLDSQSSVYEIQCLFLVLFFVVMGIVIMNLLIGLAVDDTDEIMKRSKAEERLARARLYIELEKSLSKLPACLQPKPIHNAPNHKILEEKKDDDKDSIMQARMENIQTEVKKEISQLKTESKNDMNQLKAELSELKSLLETILKRNEENDKSD